MNKKQLVAAGAALGAVTLVTATPASAADCVPVYKNTTVVDKKATTTTVVTPEVSHIVHHEAVTHLENRWTKTIPGSEEVRHTEYRFPLFERTYSPGQAEQTVRTWQKQFRDAKVQYKGKYQKFVSGKIQEKSKKGKWEDTTGTFAFEVWAGDLWNTNGSFKTGSWSDSAPVFVLESGAHGSTSDEYEVNGVKTRKVSTAYQYQLTGTETRPNGYTPWVNSGEVIKSNDRPGADTDTVQYIEGETLVTQEKIDPSFTPWVKTSDGTWSTDSTPPVDPDGQDGEDSPLNLTKVGEVETKSVLDSEAVEPKTVYYVTGGGESDTLTDANWTTDFDNAEEAGVAGWTFVDERTVTDEEAYDEKVIDSEETVTSSTVPAVTRVVKVKTGEQCTDIPELAQTGFNPAVPLGLGLIFMFVGAGAVVAARKRS